MAKVSKKEKVRAFFKTVKDKTFFYCKKYWYILLLTVAVIAGIFLMKDSDSNKMLKSLTEKYNELMNRKNRELEESQVLLAEKTKKDRENQQRYDSVIRQIQERYETESRVIEAQQKKDIHNIITSTSGDVAEMAKQINAYFGIPIYPTTKNPKLKNTVLPIQEKEE